MKFTIRDLLWLTLVVLMGFIWWCRELYLDSDLSMARNLAGQWADATMKLERELKDNGWAVIWEGSEVRLERVNGRGE
jgi:hypothetical protein